MDAQTNLLIISDDFSLYESVKKAPVAADCNVFFAQTDDAYLDVIRENGIKPLSMFEVSEMDSPYRRAPGRFGAHQFQEHMSDTRLYTAWVGGGLRIVDIKDRTAPEEIGWFIPEPAAGQPSPQSNDVEVDKRGLVYLLDRNVGLDILEVTG